MSQPHTPEPPEVVPEVGPAETRSAESHAESRHDPTLGGRTPRIGTPHVHLDGSPDPDPQPKVHTQPPAPDANVIARPTPLDTEDRAAADRALIGLGHIPPGTWRVGGDRPRNLYIGPKRPGGIDVGRMDSPELAALVCAAVNGIHLQRQCTRERGRLRAALQRIAGPPADPFRSPGDALADLRDIARQALPDAEPNEPAEPSDAAITAAAHAYSEHYAANLRHATAGSFERRHHDAIRAALTAAAAPDGPRPAPDPAVTRYRRALAELLAAAEDERADVRATVLAGATKALQDIP